MTKLMIDNFTKEEKKMNKRMIYNLVGRLRAVTAVFLMVLLSSFFAGAVSGVNAQTVKKQTASSEGGGQKEGIKVHGHWIIEVRNPNGTLVERREFENSLIDGNMLVTFLSRNGTPGLWRVELAGTNGPCLLAGAQAPCSAVEATDPSTASNISKSLTLSFIGQKSKVLVLSGSVTAAADGEIDEVLTQLTRCGPGLAPGALNSVCLNTPAQNFTGTDLATPVNGQCSPNTACVVTVVAGQIIQVTVVISFS